MMGIGIRSDDPEDSSWEKLVNKRRVRDTDNGDAMPLYAQRCMRNIKAHTYRTMIGIIASVVVTAGIVIYTYVTDQTEEGRRDLATSETAHREAGHPDSVRIREMDQLREQMMRSFAALETKIDAVIREFRDHDIRDKINAVEPRSKFVPAGD